MNNLNHSKPLRWTEGTISDLIGNDGIFIDGDWVESKDQDPNGDVRLIQLADIGDGYFRNRSNRFLTTEKAAKLKCTFLRKGDVLVARMPDPLGRCCLFPGGSKPCVTAVDVCIIRTGDSGIYNKLLMYFINSPDFRSAIESLQSGTTRKRISRKNLAGLSLPVPPLAEQHRIVAKIEELFSDLDAGVEALKRAKAQLKLYRQAVLKAAFEGRLTADWREAHKGEIEPSSKNLAKIREEKVAGKKGGVHKPKPSIDTSGLAELPKTWSWALLSELGELNRGKSKHRPRNDPKLFGGNYPFIQTGDIRKAEIIKEYSQTYNDFGLKQSSLWPENTLCITIAANIAETAILGMKACFPDSIVGFIADERLCRVKYIHYFIKTAKQELEYYAPATAQKNINLETLYGVMVPLPSVAEQEAIIGEIECFYSLADAAEATLELSFGQSERLRQSILKKAFHGELVPQDPEDEPAAVLMERIKQEKAGGTAGPRRRALKRPAKLW
jgi:type I restriction enzyme S subunit